jgi:TRAP transporter TAXI family solute receptor
MANDDPEADLAGEETLAGRLRPALSSAFWLALAQTLGPALIITVLVVAVAFHFMQPAPPSTLTIAAGQPGSRFDKIAGDYKKALAKNGIKLNIVQTEGSLDNLKRLMEPHSKIDIALVQTGTAQTGTPAAIDTGDLVSLGSMFYVPLTIFYRSPNPIERLSELHGRRIAVGPEGSGTHQLALALLKANEITGENGTHLLDLEGEAAREALLHGQVDAIFLAGDSASSDTVREMLHQAGVRLYDFPQADAYVRRFHYLNKLDLPAGSFDLGENLPPTRINMMAPTAELVAHANLHPALSDLLIEAATEVHGKATVLQNAGQFPTPLAHDLPISADAARYYKSGKSFAYRYLPFWVATLLDRAVVVLVPVILVVIPALRYVPAVYDWRVKSRINRRYRQLMALERESLRPLSDGQRTALIARLAQIEKDVIALKVPGSHAEYLYVLRQHMKFVLDNLSRQPTEAAAAVSAALAAADEAV